MVLYIGGLSRVVEVFGSFSDCVLRMLSVDDNGQFARNFTFPIGHFSSFFFKSFVARERTW